MFDPTDGCPECGTLSSEHSADCIYLDAQEGHALEDNQESPDVQRKKKPEPMVWSIFDNAEVPLSYWKFVNGQ